MAKREMAVHTRCTPTRIVKGKWETETTHFTVEVMARASGYAMVRRKGCMPSTPPLAERKEASDAGL